MSRTLARAVLSALKSTAVLVTSMSENDPAVYVYKASNTQLLAVVEKNEDELFGGVYFEILPMNGPSIIATDMAEFVTGIESLKGYPTDADNRRNYSKPVYVVTDYV